MTALPDLPIEILTNIMSLVIGEGNPIPFLCSISTLGRIFHHTLRAFIFNKIEIKSELLFTEGPAKYTLLMRSLKENPSLAGLVHEIKIEWKRGVQETYRLVNELLCLLTNLKSLHLFAEDYEESFQPYFLKVNSMPFLKNVVLDDEYLSMENIQQYLVLESVEKMKIASYFPGSFSNSSEMRGRTSRLLSLDVDENFHIPLESLHEILKICPRIESLRLAIPGKGKSGSERYYLVDGPYKLVTTPLSPLQLSGALVVASNSLQRLEILACECQWPSIDKTRMDLNLMSALKYISCPAKCFFSETLGQSYASRQGLYKLLPPGLEELRIYFDYGAGIVRTWLCLGETSTKNHESDFLWLSELATNKECYTPHLTKIHLEDEDIYEPEIGVPDFVLWEPPCELRDMLKEAKINVLGKIRHFNA